MTFTVAPIVEGHGEYEAVPILLRMLAPSLHIARPVRFPKSQLLTDPGLIKASQIARANIQDPLHGLILLILDADEDCPASLGPSLRDKMRPVANGADCFVVMAVREFESWIVGGHPNINLENPDTVGKVKERIEAINQGLYKKTVDQPRFTAAIDPDRLRARSRSFNRLVEKLDTISRLA